MFGIRAECYKVAAGREGGMRNIQVIQLYMARERGEATVRVVGSAMI